MAGQALACPTVDNLESGIRVTFDDDKYSIITRDGTGMVREVEHSDGDTFTYETDNGVLETGYIENGVRDTFSYDFETSNILPLQPWTKASGTQIVRDSNGEEIERVGFSYHTLGEGTLRIGACSFNAIKVQTYYQFEDDRTMVELTVLTDLGIPLNTAYRADGNVDVYRPISISAE